MHPVLFKPRKHLTSSTDSGHKCGRNRGDTNFGGRRQFDADFEDGPVCGGDEERRQSKATEDATEMFHGSFPHVGTEKFRSSRHAQSVVPAILASRSAWIG